MKMQKQTFSAGREAIGKFLANEGIDCSEAFSEQLFSFLSHACSYEEEGRRIKPKILLSKNFVYSEIVQIIPHAYMLPIKKTALSDIQLEKDLKALIPFCAHEWHVYVDIEENAAAYGILRSFSGPIGPSITDSLFASEYTKKSELKIISIEVLSDFELKFTGSEEKLIIDFSLGGNDSNGFEDALDMLTSDLIRTIKSGKKKNILKQVFAKIFKLSTAHVHGTICAVVKYDCQLPIKLLNDGVWLPEPLDISNIALALINDMTDIYMDEKFYGLISVILEMLNMDGITIIDTKGRLLAYNVFIKPQQTNKSIVGGARKRAFYALLDSAAPELVGAYFQSQDGQVFYARVD